MENYYVQREKYLNGIDKQEIIIDGCLDKLTRLYKNKKDLLGRNNWGDVAESKIMALNNSIEFNEMKLGEQEILKIFLKNN